MKTTETILAKFRKMINTVEYYMWIAQNSCFTNSEQRTATILKIEKKSLYASATA